jgi:tight adherence protein C
VDLLIDSMGFWAALGAALSVGALVLALAELYQRFSLQYLATLGVDEGAAAAMAQQHSVFGSTLAAARSTLIAFLAVLNERWVPERTLARLQRRLQKGGYPAELKPPELVAMMEVSGLFFLMLGLLVSIWLEVLPIGPPICFAALGSGYPLLWLNDKVRARQHALVRALPYNLDLLTLSVEAGLDFAAAIGKVVEKGRKGPLADEFAILLRELKLGKTREEGLKNLAERIDLQTVSTFVAALVQADKMGTPLGKTLRVLSTQMRVDRTQRAEKLANEAPVKLLFPLVVFIFPTMFLMLFAPIFYAIFYGQQ